MASFKTDVVNQYHCVMFHLMTDGLAVELLVPTVVGKRELLLCVSVYYAALFLKYLLLCKLLWAMT